MNMDSKAIEAIARGVVGWPEHREWNTRDKNRRFIALFGVPSEIVADLWNRISDQAPLADGSQPKHLLWSLVHLKVYGTEEVNCALVGWPSAKTFSKWAWYFVKRIADLKDDVFDLEDRFEGLGDVAETNCFITVDGTDCPAFDHRPLDEAMYSAKLAGPGLKYEVAICIITGKMVWINGPFKASVHDLTIFREGLLTYLFPEEAVEVDKGYRGPDSAKTPDVGAINERKMKSDARSQHEAMNGRLKQFHVLTTHFRHMKPNVEGMMEKHGLCFFAVAVITQLKYLAGDRVFNNGVVYDVDYF